MSQWQPIETAPVGKGPEGVFFCLLAWGDKEDPTTGMGFRWRDQWFAAAPFYRMGMERKYEMREAEVSPHLWMDIPSPFENTEPK